MRISRRAGTIFLSLCVFASAGRPACLAAGEAAAESDIVNFNAGVSVYKKEDYQKALEAFTKALASDDKGLEADALYNLGNCKYKLGRIKEGADLSAAAAHLRESLNYYKRAVEIDRENEDARFNHEFVERELKVVLEKLKQQQQSGKDKQENQDKQKQGQSQSESSAGKKEEEKEQKSGQAQEGQRKQKEEKSAQDGHQGQGEKQQEEGQAAKEEFRQAEDGKELSEESARALLERYGRDEAEPDYIEKRRGYESEAAKNW